MSWFWPASKKIREALDELAEKEGPWECYSHPPSLPCRGQGRITFASSPGHGINPFIDRPSRVMAVHCPTGRC